MVTNQLFLEYLEAEIEKVDSHYDFVAIAEYYFESLVLIREILCVPWIVLFAKSRMVSAEYEKQPFTSKQKSTLESYFKQDFEIYSKFNSSLWKRIDKYGRERMEHDVRLGFAYDFQWSLLDQTG